MLQNNQRCQIRHPCGTESTKLLRKGSLQNTTPARLRRVAGSLRSQPIDSLLPPDSYNPLTVFQAYDGPDGDFAASEPLAGGLLPSAVGCRAAAASCT